MMKLKKLYLVLAAVWAVAGVTASELQLWYEEPAQFWTEALPVGNGSLGAMVFGGKERERMQFNHDTLWTGTVHSYHNEGARDVLPELRKLLQEGKQKEAEALAMQEFMSEPLRLTFYQPFGDLYLNFPGHEIATEYRRQLDLNTAVVSVDYKVGEVQFKRETFSSYVNDVLVTRVSADRSGQVEFSLEMDCLHKGHEIQSVGEDQLLLTGKVQEDGLGFAARVQVVVTGGTVVSEGGVVRVKGADSATVILAAASSFRNFHDISADAEVRVRETLAAAVSKDYAILKSAHIADYQRLFKRVALDLGSSDVAALSTHERMRREDKSDDPQLAALLFQYGRYLLISSSRPGSQPANLQGIWNDLLKPSWGSKYTLNINFEMNYWPAQVTNLAEMAEPVYDMIEDLVISGRKTAEAHYGARGWVVHHNTDLWRATAPINHANHGIWPGGSAWLSLLMWESFRYTHDLTFLRERAFPVMREAALFYVDYLVEDTETGWLISGPSNSPEHGGLVMGPTMDHQLIRSLFKYTAEAAGLLEMDNAFAAELENLRGRIAPNQIGRHGQLQEWLEDVDDPENDHRHVSHLWGIFPGDDITWENPELMEAARQSLIFRGDGGTSWALAWKMAFWARLLDADKAHAMVMNQLRLVEDTPEKRTMSGHGGSYPNLLGSHPPFQIDGNFGTTASIAEMLLQSHTHEIVFLPTLPSVWAEGSVSGLKARGGFEVSFGWKDGKLSGGKIFSEKGGKGRFRYGDRVMDLKMGAGESVAFDAEMRIGEAYTGDLPPIELARRLVDAQIHRFKSFLPEGEVVPAQWGYIHGLFASSLIDLSKATGEEIFFDYGSAFIEPVINEDGSIQRYKLEEFNIDLVRPGVVTMDLYQKTGDAKFLKATELIREQLRQHPRTSEGGFWHKAIYPDQIWLDGLYMAMPFLAQYARDFGRPEDFEDVLHQIKLIDGKAYDPETGLYFHAWDETRSLDWADSESGLATNFWSRGIGWYGMALVDVMDFLPEDHPGRKDIVAILERYAVGIVKWQDARSGLWWQVTNEGERYGNYLEGTCAPMFVYVLAKAVNRGYLERERYAEAIRRGWQGIQDTLLDVDEAGRVHLAQCCQVAGLNLGRDGSFEYYISEPIVRNDLKGVGPMIWACIEMERYQKNSSRFREKAGDVKEEK